MTASIEHVEATSDACLRKPRENDIKFDRFGGRAKTDPAEIALVKKLDLYMMVSISAQRLTRRLTPSISARLVVHVLSQLPG